jgi:hypothetical protein
MVMELKSGATQPSCDSSSTVSGDEDDPLTLEAGGGRLLISVVEPDISGNTGANEEMEAAELPALPTRSVTLLQEGSELE